MKKTLLLLPLLALTGCGLFGSNPAPPSKTERTFFEIKTNLVEVVKTLTNYISVPTEVYHTNEVGAYTTNFIPIPRIVPLYVTVTNRQEEYTYTPKPVVADTANTAGAIGNAVVPGMGTVIAGLIGGVFGLWAKLRSSKHVGATLAQNIESIREFIKTSVPNGAQYDDVLMKFIQQHQAEAGVLQQVVSILENCVDSSDAKNAAQEVRNTIISLQNQGQPVTMAAVAPVPPLK